MWDEGHEGKYWGLSHHGWQLSSALTLFDFENHPPPSAKAPTKRRLGRAINVSERGRLRYRKLQKLENAISPNVRPKHPRGDGWSGTASEPSLTNPRSLMRAFAEGGEKRKILSLRLYLPPTMRQDQLFTTKAPRLQERLIF